MRGSMEVKDGVKTFYAKSGKHWWKWSGKRFVLAGSTVKQ